MKRSDVNITLVEGYLRLLENLSPGSKLDLIAKLSQSVKTDIAGQKSRFFKAFGAWESDKSAEQLVEELKTARKFKRRVEEW